METVECMGLLLKEPERDIALEECRQRWVVLKLILFKQRARMWTESSWLRIGFCEHGDEPLGFMKVRDNFLTR
jgi:hypothetical protein